MKLFENLFITKYMLLREASRRTPSGRIEDLPVITETPSSEGNMDTIHVESHEPTRCTKEKEEEVLSSRRLEHSDVVSQEHSFLRGQGNAESIRKAQG